MLKGLWRPKRLNLKTCASYGKDKAFFCPPVRLDCKGFQKNLCPNCPLLIFLFFFWDILREALPHHCNKLMRCILTALHLSIASIYYNDAPTDRAAGVLKNKSKSLTLWLVLWLNGREKHITCKCCNVSLQLLLQLFKCKRII